MYAIIETGGKQYRVKPGDTIDVERLSADPGSTLDLDRVLMVGGDGSEPKVGPQAGGSVVRAEVVGHPRGEKIIVFRFKSKVRYRRKTGHRQSLTRLRITDILVDGRSSAAASAEAPSPAAVASTQTEAAPATAGAQEE